MLDEHYPEDLLYHPEHDWARVDREVATLGVTWFAQDSLGELVFWDAPQIGATVTKDEAYCELESVKAVSAVVAPLSGEIVKVNQAVADDAALVNRSPYEDGWLVRVRLSEPSERGALMDAAGYRELL